MKRLLPLALVLGMLPAAIAESGGPEPSAAARAETRSAVLDLAAAFSNDGYKIRDGHWFGRVAPRESPRIALNLYAGNQYWFCAAARPEARRIKLTVYDEDGSEVPMLSYESGALAAAGITVPASGQYFVEIELLEGGASDVCFLYTFK